MKKMTWFVLLLLMATVVRSQSISKMEADSMLHALSSNPPDTQRIDLLLHLAQYQVFKPDEHKADFDSALAYIQQAKQINQKIASIEAAGFISLTQSHLAREKGLKDEARSLAQRAVDILQKGNSKYYLARAYFELSMHFDFREPKDLHQRIALVEKAVHAFKEAGKLQQNAYSLEMLGDLYGLNEEYSKAAAVLEQALAAHIAMKNEDLQGVYLLLGDCYFTLNREPEGLVYMLKALKTAHARKASFEQITQINNYLGLLYMRIDRMETAAEYFIQALKIAMDHRKAGDVISITNNLAVAYNHMGKYQKALEVLNAVPKEYILQEPPSQRQFMRATFLRTYTALGEYEKAQPFCDTILAIAANEPLVPTIRRSIYILASKFYFNKRQYVKAREILGRADLPNESWWRQKIDAYEVLYKLDSAERDYFNAFQNLGIYSRLVDSAFNTNRDKQMQVLDVEYELGMKEDSIRLRDKDIALLTQTNKLQQANLREASLIKNVTIAAVFVAIIFIALLYRQYKIKQRSSNAIAIKNVQLEHLVNEKDWLLKEIHHRVKNNLQIVMSLLNSQSSFINNPHALNAIHDTQHRVHAMSLIHQKLYGTENVSSINMNSYVRDLVSYLSDSFDTGRRIRFEYEVEPVEMDVAQAVPLGLILNEAITNSIKYAFPDNSMGIIRIQFSNLTARDYLLRIEDNGIGMDPMIMNKRSGSLGLSLMKGLSEDLNGKFSLENINGTRIAITFTIERSLAMAHLRQGLGAQAVDKWQMADGI